MMLEKPLAGRRRGEQLPRQIKARPIGPEAFPVENS